MTIFHGDVSFLLILLCLFGSEVVEEFPQEERDPVYVKEGQGAVLLCVPPKAWPGEHLILAPAVVGHIHRSTN